MARKLAGNFNEAKISAAILWRQSVIIKCARIAGLARDLLHNHDCMKWPDNHFRKGHG